MEIRRINEGLLTIPTSIFFLNISHGNNNGNANLQQRSVSNFKEKEKKITNEDDYLKKRSSTSADEYGFLGEDGKGAYKVRLRSTEIIMACKVEKKDILITRPPPIHRSFHGSDCRKRFRGCGDGVRIVETDLRSYIADLEKEESFTINEVKKLIGTDC